MALVRRDLTRVQAEELMANIRLEDPQAALELVPQTNGLFTVNIQSSAPAGRLSTPTPAATVDTTPHAAEAAPPEGSPRERLSGSSSDAPTRQPAIDIRAHSAPAELLKERRIKAMLDVIGFSEGTGENYGVVVRGRVIGPAGSPFLGQRNVVVTDFRDHPRLLVQVNSTIKSTAAGRYQFLARTWDGLDLPDFTPRSQDLGAVMLMKQRRMIEPLLNDDFDTAVERGSWEWASFPDPNNGGESHYGGQPAHPLEELRRQYREALQNHSRFL